MRSTDLLTTDDLDEIGCSSLEDDQLTGVAAELVDAVEQGRLADQTDAGYALILAAELTENAGDLPAAEVLAERAVAAYRSHDDPDYGYPRAFRARLLLRLRREDEAMAEMTALRPLLYRDADAVSYICEALEKGGRAELAEQWLTAALSTALQRRQMLESQRGEPSYEQAAVVAFTLAQYRHQLRRDLDQPHDALDDLADRLLNAVQDALPEDELGDDDAHREGFAVLFWPRMEFEYLLQRWPVLAESYGQNWDEHRAMMQRVMVQWSEEGYTRLAVLLGSADELAHYTAGRGGDPIDPQVRQDYAQHLEQHPRVTPWPPARNQTCWCGSGLKYKKCCLPRSRT